jgi:hypothetical protein
MTTQEGLVSCRAELAQVGLLGQERAGPRAAGGHVAPARRGPPG